ncbi:MAG: hypothetical protein IPF58_08530 [Saprospirales bacterium]|nr:hypothetical protein [Saprospirales bacterium]
MFTISGTPSATGTFNYTVTTTGGSCTQATATGMCGKSRSNANIKFVSRHKRTKQM